MKIKKSKFQRMQEKIKLLSVIQLLVICYLMIKFFQDNKFYLMKWKILNFSATNYNWNQEAITIYKIFLMTSLVFVAIWLALHTKYSFVQKWKLESLIRGFTEESDLLKSHDSEINETQTVRWKFSIVNERYYIELRPGGHETISKEDDIARRLLGYFIKETDINWFLEDSRISYGKIKMIFSHKPDERITINNLSKLNKSEALNIQLTQRLSWTDKQPMALVVGPTGSGKTTFIKMLILGFLANNPKKNTVYCIDGKASFLSVAMKRVGKVAVDGATALEIVSEVEDIMKQRYEEMNIDVDSEEDITYNQKFHKGNILVVADEFLSLVVTMQAEDKLLKPAERRYPIFLSKIINLITKGRQASIFVLVSGQLLPTTVLSSEARDSIGLRIALSRVSQSQATEIFNLGISELPRVDTSDYGGVIWLDGLDLEKPLEFKVPYYDEAKLPFKASLSKLVANREQGSCSRSEATVSSRYLTNIEDTPEFIGENDGDSI